MCVGGTVIESLSTNMKYGAESLLRIWVFGFNIVGFCQFDYLLKQNNGCEFYVIPNNISLIAFNFIKPDMVR